MTSKRSTSSHTHAGRQDEKRKGGHIPRDWRKCRIGDERDQKATTTPFTIRFEHEHGLLFFHLVTLDERMGKRRILAHSLETKKRKRSDKAIGLELRMVQETWAKVATDYEWEFCIWETTSICCNNITITAHHTPGQRFRNFLESSLCRIAEFSATILISKSHIQISTSECTNHKLYL